MIAVADKPAIHIQSIQKLFRFLLLIFNRHAPYFVNWELLFCRGGLAQLVEHLPCKQGVSGSIPLTSTTHYELIKLIVKKLAIIFNLFGGLTTEER